MTDADVTRRVKFVLHHVNVSNLLSELHEYIAFEVCTRPEARDADAVNEKWGSVTNKNTLFMWS